MKLSLPIDITIIFFEFLEDRIAVTDFQQWLYQTEQLEKLFSPDDYLELITIDFKQQPEKVYLDSYHEAKKAIAKIINQYADIADYRTYELKKLLCDFLKSKGDLAKILAKTYQLYCRGYSFLDNLALNYSLDIACYLEEIEESSGHYFLTSTFITAEIEQEIKQRVNSILPQVDIEVKKVLFYLKNGEIEIINNGNLLDNFEYTDRRSLKG